MTWKLERHSFEKAFIVPSYAIKEFACTPKIEIQKSFHFKPKTIEVFHCVCLRNYLPPNKLYSSLSKFIKKCCLLFCLHYVERRLCVGDLMFQVKLIKKEVTIKVIGTGKYINAWRNAWHSKDFLQSSKHNAWAISINFYQKTTRLLLPSVKKFNSDSQSDVVHVQEFAWDKFDY